MIYSIFSDMVKIPLKP